MSFGFDTFIQPKDCRSSGELRGFRETWGRRQKRAGATESPKRGKEGACIRTLNPGRPSVAGVLQNPRGKTWGPDAVGEGIGHREKRARPYPEVQRVPEAGPGEQAFQGWGAGPSASTPQREHPSERGIHTSGLQVTQPKHGQQRRQLPSNPSESSHHPTRGRAMPAKGIHLLKPLAQTHDIHTPDGKTEAAHSVR